MNLSWGKKTAFEVNIQKNAFLFFIVFEKNTKLEELYIFFLLLL